MCKCRIIYAHGKYTIYCYQSITTWKLQYKNLIFQDNTDNSRPIPGFLGWVWTLQGLREIFHYSQTSDNFPKMSQKTHKKGRSKPNQAAVSLLETPWWPGIHISHLIHFNVPIPPNITIFQINFDSKVQSQRAIIAASLSKSKSVYFLLVNFLDGGPLFACQLVTN